jgi:hypothetical protein
MVKTPPKKKDADAPAMGFDETLKRMLSSPPQHKTKPQPTAKPVEKKPAK